MSAIFALHRSRLVLVASAFLLCAMTGCGGSHHDIVGKWRTAGDSSAMVWEFSKNGAVLMGDIRGRYSFGDRDRIKIETRFATAIYQLALSGDQMTLQDPNGSRLEFTRSK
jgi:hypothetical protein